MLGESKWIHLVLILLFSLAPFAAGAADSPKSVFIHTACDGKISSEVLSSLREGIRNSQKYQLVRTLDDEGRMGIVLTIYMNCAERNDVIAVATGYGLAKCYSGTKCHLSVDGSSIRSVFCDASVAVECGRTLFKAFDDYMKNPTPSVFKLN
jgi:hypothetical protein